MCVTSIFEIFPQIIRVLHQDEYFLHIGISVLLLFSNCIVVRFCFTIITKISIFLNIVILLIITRLMIK